MTVVTCDSIGLRGAGVVTVRQPVAGHRFTLDSILLADFCRVKQNDRVLEPGSGTGIVSLLLAKKYPRASFTAIEVQPELAALCEQNLVDNGLSARMQVLRGDLRRLGRAVPPGSQSVIVANPPYVREGAGRTSPDPSRRIARQSHAAPLGSWLDLHRRLKNGGRFCLVFPAGRMAELAGLMRKQTLEPKRLRFVHPYADRPAAFVLLEAVKNGGPGADVLPPLVVHEAGGRYSGEMREIYGMGE